MLAPQRAFGTDITTSTNIATAKKNTINNKTKNKNKNTNNNNKKKNNENENICNVSNEQCFESPSLTAHKRFGESMMDTMMVNNDKEFMDLLTEGGEEPRDTTDNQEIAEEPVPARARRRRGGISLATGQDSLLRKALSNNTTGHATRQVIGGDALHGIDANTLQAVVCGMSLSQRRNSKQTNERRNKPHITQGNVNESSNKGSCSQPQYDSVGGHGMHLRRRREHKILPLAIDFSSRSSNLNEVREHENEQDELHSTASYSATAQVLELAVPSLVVIAASIALVWLQ